jgi:hypothetical protein
MKQKENSSTLAEQSLEHDNGKKELSLFDKYVALQEKTRERYGKKGGR